ncbi:Mad3/BUB1 homology region 1-domain-containing protein [Phycomyces nitens]|nr:Mad3/BUB1 homology region 1-domain-containing protein [Phycomyces nitens]
MKNIDRPFLTTFQNLIPLFNDLLDTIEQGEAKFKEELETLDERDDPLDVYLKHLDWIDQIFVQGRSHASPLQVILEQVTTRFQDSQQYKNDARYLRCWIRLSKFRNDPIKIYHHLMKQNIGQICALFYEDYAQYYEGIKKYSEASTVFEEGINKKAEPLARLKRAKDEFAARQEQRILAGRSASATQSQERNRVLERNGRMPLGVKFDSSAEFCKNFGNAYHYGGGLPQRQKDKVGSPSLATQRRFNVYSEGNGARSQSSIYPPQSMEPYTHNSPEHKENTVRVEPLRGAVLPQLPHKRRRKDSFVVFRDTAESSQPASPNTQSAQDVSQAPQTTNERSKSVLEDDHIKRLTDRFNAIQSLCMSDFDSKGQFEYISFVKNGPDHITMLSNEEERARRIESMKAKTLGIYAADNTSNLTAETRAAIDCIGEIYTRTSGLSKIKIEKDDNFYDKWLKKTKEERKNRVYTNENEYPASRSSSISDNPMLERMQTGTCSEDEDDEDEINMMLQREIEAGKAGNTHLIARTNLY